MHLWSLKLVIYDSSCDYVLQSWCVFEDCPKHSCCRKGSFFLFDESL